VIGIPLIVLSVLGWCSAIRLYTPHFSMTASATESLSLLQVDLGVVVILLAFLWYAFLDWMLALPFLLVLYGMYWIGRALPNEVCWICFLMGWMFQGVGHAVYEKNSPAFVKNLEHLLIGPFWVFAKLLGVIWPPL
jgi:uncharacterized membrane protein YGL010W